MTGKRAAFAAVIALAILLAGVLVFSRSPAAPPAPPAPASTAPPGNGASPGRVPGRAGPTPGERAALAATQRASMVAHLRSEYGARIQHPYVQVKMLEILLRYFRGLYPERWK